MHTRTRHARTRSHHTQHTHRSFTRFTHTPHHVTHTDAHGRTRTHTTQTRRTPPTHTPERPAPTRHTPPIHSRTHTRCLRTQRHKTHQPRPSLYSLLKPTPCQYHDLKLCSLHQNHIITTSLIRAASPSQLGNLYSLACSLRSGNFRKLHQACHDFLPAMVHVTQAARPVGSASYTAEVMHYYLVNSYEEGQANEARDVKMLLRKLTPRQLEDPRGLRREFSQGPDAAGSAALPQPRPRKGAALVWAVLEFAEFFNGALWEVPAHHCRGRDCCVDATAAQSRAICTTRELLLRRLPPVPALSRWSQLGRCLDFVALGCLAHGLLPALFARAIVPSDQGSKRKRTAGAEEDAEPDYHQIAGARMRRAAQLLQAPEKLLVIALVLEPIRFLSRWLFARSRESPSQHRPGLLDAINPQTSPFVAASQHISAMLSGLSSRVQILYRLDGCASFAAWCP